MVSADTDDWQIEHPLPCCQTDTVDFFGLTGVLSGLHVFLPTPLAGLYFRHCRPAICYPPHAVQPTSDRRSSTTLAVRPTATRYGPSPTIDINLTIRWITGGRDHASAGMTNRDLACTQLPRNFVHIIL